MIVIPLPRPNAFSITFKIFSVPGFDCSVRDVGIVQVVSLSGTAQGKQSNALVLNICSPCKLIEPKRRAARKQYSAHSVPGFDCSSRRHTYQ